MAESSPSNSSAHYTTSPASLSGVWPALKDPTRMRKHTTSFMNGHGPLLQINLREKFKVGKYWLRATRVKIEFPWKWCNPLPRVRPRCYYLNLRFINRRWSGLMTRFPPCPSCTELPADLGRLPASVCKPFAAGMYKQAVKIGFGWDIQDGSRRKTTRPISTAAWRGRSRCLEVGVVGTGEGKPAGSEFGPCMATGGGWACLKPRMDYRLRNAVILLTNKRYIT